MTLNIENGEYKPYRKDNDTPVFIHKDSNHPPTIKKQIKNSVQNRLSKLSSNEKAFNQAAPMYAKALEQAGYEPTLRYQPELKKKKRIRRRKVTYFTPPFSISVATNIGQLFLKLVDKHFPKGSELYQFYNRYTLKVSYSTMNNIKDEINKHNAKMNRRNVNTKNDKACNCKPKKDFIGPINCPLKGKCQTRSVVYKAEVNCKDQKNRNLPKKVYFGLTSRKFKQRYNEHMRSFRKELDQSTTLSTYVWKLKKKGLTPEVTWSIHKRAHAYSSGGRKCDLCLTEKMGILFADPIEALNTRDEIMSKCRHTLKFTLKKAKPHVSQIIPPLPS